ncbi:type II secretion system protein [Pseudoduganella namucuonensis]|uniref:type II secretion system protein n=1 Tax=Pseudoduganella namucuonensis TaxID=1035707 RepID=UPI0011608349|nr:type II secretion system protein [Pseudoduganella namucuonensis]
MYELAVVAIIFGILTGLLLERLSFYQGEAERAGVQKLVANMQAALNSKIYEAQVQGKKLNPLVLANQNPILLLQRIPENYRGEFNNSSAQGIPPGNWYFDRPQLKLVYVFSSKKSFLGDSFERRVFRVKFVRLPTKPAKLTETPEVVDGVTLIQVDE